MNYMSMFVNSKLEEVSMGVIESSRASTMRPQMLELFPLYLRCTQLEVLPELNIS